MVHLALNYKQFPSFLTALFLNTAQNTDLDKLSNDRRKDEGREVHTLNGKVFSHEKGWNSTTCVNMKETGRHSIQQNSSGTENHLFHALIHLGNSKEKVISRSSQYDDHV